MNRLTRTDLVTAVLSDNRHVLMSAPSGYGKSLLMEQLAEVGQGQITYHRVRPGDTGSDLLTLGVDNPGHVALVDDAQHLEAVAISALLRSRPEEVRFVIAARHQQYPRLVSLWQERRVRVMSASALALTHAEVAALNPQLQAEAVLRRTLGWPALVNILAAPAMDAASYFNDLFDDLPVVWQNRISEFLAQEGSEADTAALVEQLRHEGGLTEILAAGFPIIDLGGEMNIHPAMVRHLTESTSASRMLVPPGDDTLENLKEFLPTLEVPQRLHLLERYFAQHGQDDDHLELKIEVLSTVTVRELSPHLRDYLASYLFTSGQIEQATHALLTQQDMGTDTTHTHALFGRVANHRSDFLAFAEHVRIGHELARTDADHARALTSEASYLIRLNRYEEAIAVNERSYLHATRSGRLDLHLGSLTQNAYVRFMAGQTERATVTAKEALDLAEREGTRFTPQLVYVLYQLAEIMKDRGNHAEAMDLVQRGLNLHAQKMSNTLPYLYNSRGLLYLELGELERAIQSFDASIEVFKKRGNPAGLLMPHSFAAYAHYWLGQHEAFQRHLRALHTVVDLVGTGQPEYEEYRAYLPLVEGLDEVIRERPQAALEKFAGVLTAGTLGYDSVLLTRLEELRVRAMLGVLQASDSEALLQVMDARHEDATVRMYAPRYTEAFTALAQLGVQPGRFADLAAHRPDAEAQINPPPYVLKVQTLGRTVLIANGIPVTLPSRSLACVYVLTYLHLQNNWKTTDALASELFSYRSDPRNAAQKATSELRGLLSELDHELEGLMSRKYHPSGYRLMPLPGVRVETDVDVYLSEAFTPGGDPDELEQLLSDLTVFCPRLDCEWTRQVNRHLADRAVDVAVALGAKYMNAGQALRAARIILYGIGVSMDAGLMRLLVQASMRVPDGVAQALRSAVRILESDSQVAASDVVTDALSALSRQCCAPEPKLPAP